MRFSVLIFTLAFLWLPVFGQTIRFEQDTLFVKLSPGSELPHDELISSSKHLFGDIWQITAQDVISLENKLLDNSQVLWTEKSFYAGPRDLALPRKTKITFSNELTGFNDPRAAQVWSFRDASRHGVSVDSAYLQLPQHQPKEVIVAVVDTGVDYNHEDLRNVMWVNQNEIPNNQLDDDNNGYVDDYHGIDTLTRNQNGEATGDPMASHDHGTHVAGTIAAEQNNSKGIAGIASHAKIMAIRTVPDDGDETDKDVVESFLYAAKNGAKLINCSFGKKVNEGGMVVSEAIKHIGENYGTLVVAAAGNDSSGPFSWFDIDRNPRYPASFKNDHLLVIAASESRGNLASFSNVGKIGVDLAAPGQDILSSVPGNRYASYSGTSMATPTTVGVAAQVLSYYPDLGPLELKALLMNSVTPVSAFKERMVSGGRVDLLKALQLAESN